MTELIWIIALIVVGIALLAKGADFLVNGSTDLARFFRVSPLLIGLTVVAFGTSLPEFFVSMTAVLKGVYDIAVGNIIGSNISNIGLIIGISALIYPLAVKAKTLSHEFPFLVVSSFLFVILANDRYLFRKETLSIGWFDGIIFIFAAGLFLYYIYSSAKEQRSVMKEFAQEFKHKNPLWKNIVFIISGIIMLVAGGKLLVNSSTEIANYFGIGTRFVGLTIVAVGTSLPELFTCVVAALKKEADIALGNIVGSNIFNILFVFGATGIVKTITIGEKLLFIDSIIMIFFTLLFLLFATKSKKIKRYEGVILLMFYAGYIIFLARTL